MAWFQVLAVTTALVRGLGAGIIYDSSLVSPRTRHRIGPPAVAWWSAGSLAATALAFAGTGLALPALLRVTRMPPDRPAGLEPLLDRYARWYGSSALWQAAAFVFSVLALVAR